MVELAITATTTTCEVQACVYAGCKHIRIFGCSGELSPQSP
jgi:hypothetical protein